MTTETIELQRILAFEHPVLRELLGRAGTRAVLLAGSQDPNAKLTVVLIDEYGPSFVIKIPTTRSAETVVRNEGRALEALSALPLGRLRTTLPRPVGFMSHEGRSALVSTALTGEPMTVAYHSWHHTSRRRNVRRDFAAAAIWLDDLQTRTAGARSQISLFSDSAERISRRFAGHPQLAAVKRVLSSSGNRLSSHTTPRTVMHGDFWFGNVLMHGNKVNGVVDWESCAMSGEPLRDVARFAISYALYLDRHTRPNRRVHGHRGLRADAWGAGVTYMLSGRGWFSTIVQNYLTLALGRLGVPSHLWRDVLIGGIADIAATADHSEFAERHFQLLADIIPSVRTIALVPVSRQSVSVDDLPADADADADTDGTRDTAVLGGVSTDSKTAGRTSDAAVLGGVSTDSKTAGRTRDTEVLGAVSTAPRTADRTSDTVVLGAVSTASKTADHTKDTTVIGPVSTGPADPKAKV